MAKIGKQQCMGSRDQWRTWLAENHAVEKELWLVFHKKHMGKPGLTYEEAIEEALCFGWIDGILKRIDDEKHTIRFSPRRKNSIWSENNKTRVAKLIKQRRMAEAGLAKIKAAKANGQWDKATVREDPVHIPNELAKALAKNENARRDFEKLAPSYRKHFIYWIDSAKRDETRCKRVREAIELLAQNKKLGLK